MTGTYSGVPTDAFNGLLKDTNRWFSNVALHPNVGPQWLKFEFPTTEVITSYRIWAAPNGNETRTPEEVIGNTLPPKTWTFEASIDDINWVILDTQTNITDWATDTYRTDNVLTVDQLYYASKEFAFNNTTHYKYYRIHISEAGNGMYPNDHRATSKVIGELALYKLELVQPPPPKYTQFDSALHIYKNENDNFSINTYHSSPMVSGTNNDIDITKPMKLINTGTNLMSLEYYDTNNAIQQYTYSLPTETQPSPITLTGSVRYIKLTLSGAPRVLP